jgi:hypothetical protein
LVPTCPVDRRVRAIRIVQRRVLYLGEIDDGRPAAWRRTIDVFAEGQARRMALFPEDRALPGCGEASAVARVRLGDPQLGDPQLGRPRRWGGCRLACRLWDRLGLDAFWSRRPPAGGKGTRWLNVLRTLVV